MKNTKRKETKQKYRVLVAEDTVSYYHYYVEASSEEEAIYKARCGEASDFELYEVDSVGDIDVLEDTVELFGNEEVSDEL